jgi:peptide/nickel transport system substrate-binding protein
MVAEPGIAFIGRPMRMPLLGRCLALAVVAAAALSTGACQRKSQGVVQVLVIGDQPRLADPLKGGLSAGDAVLVNNAAQGLVRFDARGQVEPGLAETWIVSDDGLSYIFRLANGKWSNGRKITADQVARMLRRLLSSSSRDPVKDALGAVNDVVAMTDRVIEVRLNQPRPQLLQLLAQPEMGLVNQSVGSGPFAINRPKGSKALRLTREIDQPDGEKPERDELDLAGAKVGDAVEAFAAGNADLVLGGTFADLLVARSASLPRRALQFDPASGLFGLVPGRNSGPIAKPDVRRLLSEAIDRDALISAFNVPGLAPRATVLEPGLDSVADPVPPAWTATALADRQAALAATAKRLFSAKSVPTITVALPEGPGADLLFKRLSTDWTAIGITVRRVRLGETADLRLVDEVARSTSPSWFVRHFRCEAVTICDERLDELLKGARETAILAQRGALLQQAAAEIDGQQLFIAIAAPIRWSLVSGRIAGFAGNRFAIHTLTELEQRLDRTGE